VPIGPARIYHVNVNCSDLDKSTRFYGERLGLRPAIRTTTKPQPLGALGLASGAWDAWLMSDGRGWGEGVVVDLLEWREPRPEGHPAASGDLGYTTLLIESPLDDTPSVDLDGTAIDVTRRDTTKVAGVRIGCRDLERSVAFWTEVVGLIEREPRGGTRVLSDARGPETFAVELVAAGEGVPPDRANRLGLYRMAFLTTAVADDHRVLAGLQVPCLSEPQTMDMGPGLPAVTVLAFRDPDGTVVELIEPPG
jgi:catechol 2,3-dioxygenase-like lactoylglutathione lyase family enzyme